jgi:hypothetical protein
MHRCHLKWPFVTLYLTGEVSIQKVTAVANTLLDGHEAPKESDPILKAKAKRAKKYHCFYILIYLLQVMPSVHYFSIPSSTKNTVASAKREDFQSKYVSKLVVFCS